MCLFESLCKKEVNPVASVEEDGDGGEDDQRPLVNLTIIKEAQLTLLMKRIEKMRRGSSFSCAIRTVMTHGMVGDHDH